MRAWRVHGTGEPASVFVEEDVPEPVMADLEGLGMGLAGWCPPAPGTEPFTDFVIMRMAAAALSLPDVTMARGTYPVPVARPYTSGQEGVGTVIDAPRSVDISSVGELRRSASSRSAAWRTSRWAWG